MYTVLLVSPNALVLTQIIRLKLPRLQGAKPRLHCFMQKKKPTPKYMFYFI